MTKKLLIFTFIFMCMSLIPMSAHASELGWNSTEQIEEQSINITVEQSSLHITGAAGQMLEIVSLTGKPVAKIRIESPAQRIELNIPKGCYILKVGTVVRKVSIR